MLLVAIIGIPVFLSVISLALRKDKAIGYVNAAGYGIGMALSVCFCRFFLAQGSRPVSALGWLYADALSVFFLVTTSLVCFAASIYSIGYVHAEVDEGKISVRKAGAYYHLFNLFCFTMMVATLLNNLALVWISIEMTTLVSAFLVGFTNVKESIEAAWKYIIICSVGITFALLGIIFFYYTSSKNAGVNSLEWARMLPYANLFDPRVVKIAFIFILIGYGTKAGLAPMHNWLPDAHSQALSPISGLLSGVLLKISIYAILRYVVLTTQTVGYAFCAKLFILFGLCSLAVAAGFILVQKDLKRLLAYSSVENIGIISLGLGFGPFGGIVGSLFHVLNHAAAKAGMFFCAGEAVRAYHTNSMNKMQGMIQAIPFTAAAMFIGLFALVGMPPFAIFLSKLAVISAMFQGKGYFVAGCTLVFIAVAFAGLIHHVSRVILGNKPHDIARRPEPATTKAALIFLGLFVVALGVWVPQPLMRLILECQYIILGQ